MPKWDGLAKSPKVAVPWVRPQTVSKGLSSSVRTSEEVRSARLGCHLARWSIDRGICHRQKSSEVFYWPCDVAPDG
jgi:hypothetical protein